MKRLDARTAIIFDCLRRTALEVYQQKYLLGHYVVASEDGEVVKLSGEKLAEAIRDIKQDLVDSYGEARRLI